MQSFIAFYDARKFKISLKTIVETVISPPGTIHNM